MDIDKVFAYHPPIGNQQVRYIELRNAAKEFASLIAVVCPESREKSLALTAVQQATMWANASIAINEAP